MDSSRHAERLAALRDWMRQRGWSAVVIGGGDPHGSEYVSPRWRQVEWLSGFSGEGDAVVTSDHAGVWTDSRYFIQAGQQLTDTGFTLHKTRLPESIPVAEWLERYFAEPLEDGQPIRIAVDGWTLPAATATAFPAGTLVDMPDLLSNLWTDRPEFPCTPVLTLGEDLCGESREHKIQWLRKQLQLGGCDAILLTRLDEICWLLNVRGSDVDYNPVVLSWLLVTMDGVDWFVRKGDGTPDPETADSFDELAQEGIRILDYDELEFSLSAWAADGEEGRLQLDPDAICFHLGQVLDALVPEERLCRRTSPIALRKSVKNAVEISGFREAHLEDGLAMERFLFWLERKLASGEAVSEWDAAVKLGALRGEVPGYRGDSFETISAWGPGAALPHYNTPHGEKAPLLEPRGLYLVDSGGQYLFGTTDLTRTIPLGPCTPLEAEDYTLVLKGHIDLAMAVFPAGTAGCQLDALARNPLWLSKRNFGHGTGHGVGFFLNVHEGPQDIRQNFNDQPLLPGMVTSDEPGIYREGSHGVRHENLLLCIEAGANEFGRWYAFEPLTLCHFETSILRLDLLTESERKWLNAYHRRVYETLSPRLSPEEAAWLREKCGAI